MKRITVWIEDEEWERMSTCATGKPDWQVFDDHCTCDIVSTDVEDEDTTGCV